MKPGEEFTLPLWTCGVDPNAIKGLDLRVVYGFSQAFQSRVAAFSIDVRGILHPIAVRTFRHYLSRSEGVDTFATIRSIPEGLVPDASCHLNELPGVRWGRRETGIGQVWIGSFPFGRETCALPVEHVSLLCVCLERAVVDMPHEVVKNGDLISRISICPMPDSVCKQFS